MEVGKTYRRKSDAAFLATVLYVDDRVTLMALNDLSRSRFCVYPKEFYNWVEVKEPLTITKYFNVYKRNNNLELGSNYWDTSKQAKDWAKSVTHKRFEYVDTIPVTYSEKSDG